MERSKHSDPEAELHSELTVLAQKHIGGPLQFGLLDYAPRVHADQRLIHTHSVVSPDANLDVIQAYASIAAGESVHPGRFKYIVKKFRDQPELLESISEKLRSGKNIALVTNHSQLHDIAVVQSALVCALGDPELIKRNAIMISKLVTRFEAFGQPATKILSNLANVYFSLPRSKSIFNSKIDNDIASLANTSMLQDMSDFMHEGGKLVAVAPSGSTDERDYELGKLDKLTLQRMSTGTAELLTQFNVVLPVSVWLESIDDEYSTTIGQLIEVKDKQDAHELMELLAAQLSHLAGVTTHYESERLSGLDKIKNLGRVIGKNL